MNRITILLFAVLIAFISSCEKEDIDPNDENTNPIDTTDNTENNIPQKYLILLASNDTVPLFTSSITYSDTIRHIYQVNFKDDNFNYSLVITYKAEPTESFDYETTNNRAFHNEANASDKVNIYATNWDNGKNYHVESGKTFSYTLTDSEYGYEFTNLVFTEEVDGVDSFSATIMVVHQTN